MKSVGEYLIELLEGYDVEYVFGIPGVHTAELYRGLAASKIQHITPRHEQSAGFMADGYARVSGKPGVCLVITGPGLANIATAMFQARADSVPMLVISGVNDLRSESKGHLHEMPDQAAFASTVAIKSTTITCPEQLAPALSLAFQNFKDQRPGPTHIQVPLKVMNADCSDLDFPSALSIKNEITNLNAIQKASELINRSENPIVLAGGGAMQSANAIKALVDHLGCACITTVNARTLLDFDHPAHISASPSLKSVRNRIEESDLVIAIGTELGSTDYDMYETGTMPNFSTLIQIDIDKSQISKMALGIEGKAESILPKLLTSLNKKSLANSHLARRTNSESKAELSTVYQEHLRFLESIRNKHPNCIYVGDSTQLTYAGNLGFAPGIEGGWFNSATGFGTLGYALPSAIGAKLGTTNQPVIAMVGDVGLQFVLAELGTLRDLDVPIVVLLWNNAGSGEIRNYMVASNIEPEGVDVRPPDFTLIAQAYGIPYINLDNLELASVAIDDAIDSACSTLIEINVT